MSYHYWPSIVLLSVMLHPLMQAQQRRFPEEYVPSAGDTLDAVEREYYKLFPAVTGFQWAAFFLNPDSSLQANVCVVLNGTRRLIATARFRSISDLEYRTSNVYRSLPGYQPEYKGSSDQQRQDDGNRWHLRLTNGSTLLDCAVVDQRNDSMAVVHQGKFFWIPVTTLTKLVQVDEEVKSKTCLVKIAQTDTMLACTLLELDDASLVVQHHGKALWIPVEAIENMAYKKSAFGRGVLYGVLVGVPVGALIGGTTADGSGSFGGLEKLGGILGGGGIGLVTGFTIGGIIGAAEGKDEVRNLAGKNIPEKLAVIRSIMYE